MGISTYSLEREADMGDRSPEVHRKLLGVYASREMALAMAAKDAAVFSKGQIEGIQEVEGQPKQWKVRAVSQQWVYHWTYYIREWLVADPPEEMR